MYQEEEQNTSQKGNKIMISQIILTIAASLMILVLSIGGTILIKKTIVTLWEDESYVELFLFILISLVGVMLIGILLRAIGL